MHLRLNHQQPATRPQSFAHLLEQSSLVRDLMHHPEGKRDVEWAGDTQPRSVGLMQLDPGQHPCPLRPPLDARQHAGLDVHGGHAPRRPGQPRHGDGEVAPAAAQVQRPVTGTHQAFEYPFRVVKAATDRVVEDRDEPPRTDTFLPPEASKNLVQLPHLCLTKTAGAAHHATCDALYARSCRPDVSGPALPGGRRPPCGILLQCEPIPSACPACSTMP